MYENIKTYFEGAIAYFYFLRAEMTNGTENKDAILDNKYQTGAILASLTNLLFATKEDIVENEGELIYSSKVFDQELVKAVNIIGTIEQDGVKVDGYIFTDKETLVATIRNKLAHGNYEIDFDKSEVILSVKNNSVHIDIKTLSKFIVAAFQTTIRDYKGSVYRRNYSKFKVQKQKKIKDKSDLRRILHTFTNTIFELRSNDNSEIDKAARTNVEEIVKLDQESFDQALKSPLYQAILSEIQNRNCTLTQTEKKLSEDEIDYIIESFDHNDIFQLDDFETQIALLKLKLAKCFDDKNPKFDIALANLRNLIMLGCISKTNSVDHNKILREIVADYKDFRITMEEITMSVISMFISLYMYPFELYYLTTKEYQAEKKDLNFSLLDTSHFNVEIMTINDNALKEMKMRCDSCMKKSTILDESINKCKQNLENLKKIGKQQTIAIVESQLQKLEQQLETIKSSAEETKSEYESMQKDYSGNFNYFKNEGIMIGIRNSIAHGNYRIVIADNPIIIFEDIYEGDTTFKASITLDDFYDFVFENARTVLELIKGKEKQV